ncbi:MULTISPECIES: hypothetical protein [unclassified Halorubrum]|uniref:DUF7508 domain-containing protein n=1 Tax=unclassified Halorubrum TaxID=2642239 RepID=UPI0010F701B8|nr:MULTISPECIES: hypothetical protein [unclassified Halorubrum]TKX42685.1 hypothetical protein EXE50_13330 [Halorubrum sp. ARQ200]TKX51383.1 hypothetical protein EXE49_00395 [Halorubrum sp. ASP121]
MSLAKPWRDLDRSTVGSAPSRYALYEFGDADGDTVGFGTGVLRDELKEALAYGDAAKVRWELADSLEHTERLLAEHTDG